MASRNHRSLAALLFDRRTELGLRQDDAAKKIGVHTEEVGRWERGEVLRPNPENRRKIARFLKMDVSELNDLLGRADRRSMDDAGQHIIDEIERLRQLVQRRNGDDF